MKEQISVDEHKNCSCPNCVPGKMYQLPAQEQVSIDEIPETIKDMVRNEPIAFFRLVLASHPDFIKNVFDDLAKEYDRLKQLEEELESISECVNHEITPAKIESVQFEKTLVVMTIDCYKRLKRLDENRKWEIDLIRKTLKNIKDNPSSYYDPAKSLSYYLDQLESLESLDK